MAGLVKVTEVVPPEEEAVVVVEVEVGPVKVNDVAGLVKATEVVPLEEEAVAAVEVEVEVGPAKANENMVGVEEPCGTNPESLFQLPAPMWCRTLLGNKPRGSLIEDPSNFSPGVASERTSRRSPSGPQKAPDTEAPKRTTRTTPDTLKMAGLLTKGREELYQLSTSSTQWATETHESAYAYLVAKGFAEERQNIQISVDKTALVLLRIAAQGGPATTTDAIRAVAVMLEHRRIDHALDDIRDELRTLSDLATEAAKRDEAREAGEASASHTLLEAASVLTRTVDEQVDSLRTTTELLDRATCQATEAADAVNGEGPAGPALNPPASTAAGGAPQRTYAAAAGGAAAPTLPSSRACAVALAKAAQRETEILIARAPEVTTHGLAKLTSKEIVAKARMAMAAAATATGQDPPEGAAFVGARLLRSGDRGAGGRCEGTSCARSAERSVELESEGDECPPRPEQSANGGCDGGRASCGACGDSGRRSGGVITA
ncbi:hypothetical protein C8J57DRAFT_1212307 [Mycena rebaudengoi]|nr:hypothetical protein C8J57DRAFT_1212307 [Mycena rebaudengoi]